VTGKEGTQDGNVGAAAVAIANLVAIYAERVDLGDFAAVGELFADASYRALVPDGVSSMAGAEQVSQALRRMVLTYDGVPATKHVTTNLIIDVDEPAGTATCRSYFTVLQAVGPLTLQPIIAGRYHDAFTRVDDVWRFSDRLIFSDLIGDLSHHLRVDPY
jgi:hypothetical protein